MFIHLSPLGSWSAEQSGEGRPTSMDGPALAKTGEGTCGRRVDALPSEPIRLSWREDLAANAVTGLFRFGVNAGLRGKSCRGD
jgi:hypothetical protein